MKFTMDSSHRPNAAFSQIMMENIGWCVLGGERVAEEVRKVIAQFQSDNEVDKIYIVIMKHRKSILMYSAQP